MSAPNCRTCGSDTVSAVGTLPAGHLFAGRRLTDALAGGSLWRCTKCDFVFRDPLLEDHVYERLYRMGSLDVWDSEQQREDFQLIRRYLLRWEGLAKDVVDIGCYTGQLLTLLPKSFRLFGVEPNLEASKVAAARGVTVVASTVDDFALANEHYDLIMACDVIEHVPNPLALLQQLGSRLKPTGRLLITTGNCDVWLWRLIGADYWYCRFPEHISFIGTRWVRKMPQSVGLKLIDLTPFNCRGGTVNASRILAALLHKVAPRIYRSLRPVPAGASGGDVPPGGGATRDHMLCIFEAL
jgi:SAM-dependent methyltransferase